MHTSFVSLLLFAAPVAVSACEGECIVQITNAFLGNYTEHIQTVFESIVNIARFCIAYNC